MAINRGVSTRSLPKSAPTVSSTVQSAHRCSCSHDLSRFLLLRVSLALLSTNAPLLAILQSPLLLLSAVNRIMLSKRSALSSRSPRATALHPP